MRSNKFFIAILLNATLFFGMTFGMSQQNASAQQNVEKNSTVSTEYTFGNTIQSIQDTLSSIVTFTMLVPAVFVWGVIQSPRFLGFYSGLDSLRSQFGPYLPTYLSYFKQIESTLGLIKLDKEQSGMAYNTDDCVSDIANIVNAYNEVGSVTYGKLNLNYNRDKEIKKRILKGLVQKYESFLPENVTYKTWLNFKDKGLDLRTFKTLSKKYKDNLELKDAMSVVPIKKHSNDEALKEVA